MASSTRIYSKQTLLGLGLLIGPIAFLYGGLRNAKHTVNRKRRIAQILTSIIPFVLTTLFVFLPLPGASTTSLSSSLGIISVILIVQKFFSPEIEEHEKNAGKFLNPWPTAVALLFVTLSIVGSVFYFFYRQAYESVPISAKDFALIATVSRFDADKFDEQTNQIFENDQQAVAIINSGLKDDIPTRISKLKQAENLWSDNVQISKDVSAMEYLPDSLKEYVRLINSYSQYQQSSAIAEVNNLKDPTDKASYEDFYNYSSRADEVLDEIEELY